jgi:DNA-binding FrmR family transcriptional regulator
MPKKRMVAMNAQTKATLCARLRTIEGHVRGILRMVDADAYCPEILMQALAVQRAIDRFNFELLEQHLETCFLTALQSESPQTREQALKDLLQVVEASAQLKTPSRARLAPGDRRLTVHAVQATLDGNGSATARLERG